MHAPVSSSQTEECPLHSQGTHSPKYSSESSWFARLYPSAQLYIEEKKENNTYVKSQHTFSKTTMWPVNETFLMGVKWNYIRHQMRMHFFISIFFLSHDNENIISESRWWMVGWATKNLFWNWSALQGVRQMMLISKMAGPPVQYGYCSYRKKWVPVVSNQCLVQSWPKSEAWMISK